ncbi:RidA family protein [Rhizobium leguminosarum]|uniref:RidA family protein n=1 Tax=Rhizobium TaxID=379 RepID=UPI000DE53495|nr:MULTISPECIES: RidA family protein [Rhizobium]MDH6658903.1 enamine deaminase RidA (YjgF/YER057c/UK114 family) [Rhizobium sophorae]MBB4521775.1 enamine deaminase RidA (YjgF/YER057c/UK114 family) [Rhizobium leguminosarum]MBY5902863.1 RidA family protein [Rhizobium leguminosarum]MBY5909906.1 RidA family protein [Rhizobium leguminosarum]MCJ9693301.1 RidA family protein [Rhizobium sp. PRIMUS64]
MMGQAKVDETLLADAAYLPGQVANLTRGASVTAQTNEILERINDMLLREGTDKSEIILVNIWLRDLASFEEMNRAWDAWIPDSGTPRRATFEDKNLPPMCAIRIDVAASRKSEAGQI